MGLPSLDPRPFGQPTALCFYLSIPTLHTSLIIWPDAIWDKAEVWAFLLESSFYQPGFPEAHAGLHTEFFSITGTGHILLPHRGLII